MLPPLPPHFKYNISKPLSHLTSLFLFDLEKKIENAIWRSFSAPHPYTLSTFNLSDESPDFPVVALLIYQRELYIFITKKIFKF